MFPRTSPQANNDLATPAISSTPSTAVLLKSPLKADPRLRYLTPIEEDEKQRLQYEEALKQTVAFTEKLAAVKVFLETQYHSPDFKDITPRSLRRRQMELSLYLTGKSPRESASIRRKFRYEESNHLRQQRLRKARRLREDRGITVSGYQPLRILGKGSFGLVRLVRDLSEPAVDIPNSRLRPTLSAKKVYAMKVIRKDEMLRSCQEAHLRAERDFLADASGASKWVVPLRASFQDMDHLYLVMEYAIGGDFLGLLLREDVISESHTQFYLAEMICCIEEAHNMGWIHRDVKPDNFLIAANGHLKISDFGLAFDGEWPHTQSYYYHRRYSLLEELRIHISGDEDDKCQERRAAADQQSLPYDGAQSVTGQRYGLLRNRDPRSLRRALANSVVGTSQYMAPEVIKGGPYDGRCD